MRDNRHSVKGREKSAGLEKRGQELLLPEAASVVRMRTDRPDCWVAGIEHNISLLFY